MLLIHAVESAERADSATFSSRATCRAIHSRKRMDKQHTTHHESSVPSSTRSTAGQKACKQHVQHASLCEAQKKTPTKQGRGLPLRVRLHTLMMCLVSLAVSAAIFLPVCASGRMSGPVSQRSRSALSTSEGDRGHAQAVVRQGDLVASGHQHRQLQLINHGIHNIFANPKCPGCKIWGCSPSQLLWTGHCRRNWRLQDCYRWKNNPNFFVMSDIPNSASAGNASMADEVLAVFETSDRKGPAVVASIACHDDSDCALPAVEFASISGEAPASAAGLLSATCVKAGGQSGSNISDEELGVCVCTYSCGAACRVAATSSASASSHATLSTSGSGNSSTGSEQNFTSTSSESSEVSSSSDSVIDICIRRSGFDTVRVVSGPSASLKLVNSTAAKDVTLGVGVPSAAAEARAQDVAIGDEVYDGVFMLSAETSQLGESTYEYDYSDRDTVDYEYSDSGYEGSGPSDVFEVTMQSRDYNVASPEKG